MDNAPAQNLESIELACEIQRELSLPADPASLVSTFIASLMRVLPLSRVMYILPWPPAAGRHGWLPGPEVPAASLGYRILLDIDLNQPNWRDGANFRERFTPQTGAEAHAAGGLLGEIIAQKFPVLRETLVLSPAEPGLGPAAAGHRSMLAVPIFWQGRTQGWIVAFADSSGAFTPHDLRMLLTTGNMLARSAVYLDTLEEAKLANTRLRGTFHEMGRVQRTLLPAKLPSDPRLGFASSYMTCDAAGGDYYDVHEPDPDTLNLVIADVSGHGAVASVAMAMLRTAMQSWCRGGHAPRTVVPQINELMHASLDAGMFITACFLSLDRRTGKLDYVNCGHNYPMVRRSGGGIELLDSEGGPPLGICAELDPVSGSLMLAPGDILVLYTDGITEAFSPNNELLGMEGLVEAVERGGGDPERTKLAVLATVDRHAAGRPRVDDQTLVVMGYRLG
jgi:sigma-B regulation protein RsbU (phosphoserine phosphatase)